MRHMPASSALPGSSGTGLVPISLTRPSDLLEQTGDYSFANINVGRAVSAVTAGQQRAVESASGTTLEVSFCSHLGLLDASSADPARLHLRTSAFEL